MWRPWNLAAEGSKDRLIVPLSIAKLGSWRIDGKEHWLLLLSLPLTCYVTWARCSHSRP